MTPIGVQNSKAIPASVRLLIRPMLFLALGLHALLLFVPLPTEKKLPQPDDQKDPIKITQIPTAKPATLKPKPTTAIKLTTQPAIAPKPASLPLRSAGAAIAPSQPKPQPALIPSSTARSQTQSPPPPSSNSQSVTSAQSATSSKLSESFKGDPAQALHEFLASLASTGGTQFSGSSNPAKVVNQPANNIAPLAEITRPELLFKPSTNPNPEPQKIALEGLPGLDKQPLLVTFALEDNLNLYSFYQKTLEPKLKTIFAETSEVGDYGDGPLYKLTRGSYTAYLSLMPPKKAVGAIISVWSKDPRLSQSVPPTGS